MPNTAKWVDRKRSPAAWVITSCCYVATARDKWQELSLKIWFTYFNNYIKNFLENNWRLEYYFERVNNYSITI